jgi:hypothetical protein
MKITDFSDALAAVRAAVTDSLAAQADEVTEAAEGQGLLILPGRVDAGNLVELDSTVLTAGEVVTVAAAAGARLLYLRRVVLDQETVSRVLEDVDVAAERTKAGKALARVTGWIGRIEVGFAHHGVLHLWETSVPWHDILDELATSTARASRWDPEPDDHNAFGEEKIAELAGQVATSQEFRRARWGEREAVAEKLPVLAALKKDPKAPRWTVSSVIRKANDMLRLQADDRATALEARKDELAAALAADPEFGAIRTADARLRFTKTWMCDHHSDGLVIEDWLLKELVKVAADIRKNNGPTQLAL